MLKNESGVSEIIGALMILLIMVISLGSIQVYEVPKWNKALEEQQFDMASAEFINLKSDLEDVSSQSVPKTNTMHMGVKYPERFMLRNPAPAYGTLTTYPLNIAVNITLMDSDNNITYNEIKFKSSGIEYQLNGLSTFPKLVYEHGLIIKDFGITNLTDDTQSLLIGDEFFIPIVDASSITLSSTGTESLNLKPLEMAIFNTSNTGVELNITRINITIDTKYNKIWNETFKDTNVRIEGNKIKINLNGPTSSSRKYFIYPTENPYKDSIYFGMLKFTSNLLKGERGDSGSGGGSGGGTKGDTGARGANCYDSIPDVNNDGFIDSKDCLDYVKNSIVQAPPFTTINTSKPYYPLITNIQIEASSGTPDFRKTHANITATVSNITSRLSIHADLTGLQRDVNILSYNAVPDVVLGTPDWSLGKTNTVRWSNIQYPDFGSGTNVPIVVSFWASNDVNGLYYTVRAYIYQGGTSWYS